MKRQFDSFFIQERPGEYRVDFKIIIVRLVPEARVIEPDRERRCPEEAVAAAEIPFVCAFEIFEKVYSFHVRCRGGSSDPLNTATSCSASSGLLNGTAGGNLSQRDGLANDRPPHPEITSTGSQFLSGRILASVLSQSLL